MKTSHPEAVAAANINPGETLRNAREQRGWTLAEVAAQLNLTPLALSQIETGQFEKLPGHTFARGYIRAYAKLLDLDQAALVSEFDRFTGTDATGSSVHALGRIEEPVRLSQSILRIVCFLFLVVLGFIGFFWWQGQSGHTGNEQAAAPIEHVEVESADGTTQVHPIDEPEDQAVQQAQQPEAPVPPVSPDLAAPPEQTAGAEAPAGEPSMPVGSAAGAATPPASPEGAEPPAAAASTKAPAPAEGQGLVHVQFIDDCWVQVTDANGKVLANTVKHRGDVLELTGTAPLEVRLGFARGAQLSYNGTPVDLSSSMRGLTARVKLGQ